MISKAEKSIFSIKEIAIFRRIVKMIDSIDESKISKPIKQKELSVAVGTIFKLPVCFSVLDIALKLGDYVRIGDDTIINVYTKNQLPMVQMRKTYSGNIKNYDDKISKCNYDLINELIKMMRPSGFSLSRPV